jgi:hypothetical protein
MATHGGIPPEPVLLLMEEDYESIANLFFSLSQQGYRIYNGWYRAPGTYGVASEKVGDICLLLRRTSDAIHRLGQIPTSLLRQQLQANVDDLNNTIANIESTLKTLTDLVNKYQSDSLDPWNRLAKDKAGDREIVRKAILDILFYKASLDILWLSISDSRYLNLNTHLDSIYTDECESNGNQYILYGLQDDAYLEEGWQQLVLRLTWASYNANAIANARAEIESYMKFKIQRSPRPLVSPPPWNTSNIPSAVEAQSNSNGVKPNWMTLAFLWFRFVQILTLIALAVMAGFIFQFTHGFLNGYMDYISM